MLPQVEMILPPPAEEYRVNISRIKDYLTCPAYYNFRWRLRRAPAFSGVALYTGTAWHAGMETLLRTGSTTEAVDAIDLAYAAVPVPPRAEVLTDLERDQKLLKLLLPNWKKPDDWQVEFVEKMFELELPDDIVVFGRVDAVVRWNGLLWHLQHKSVSPSTPIANYCRGIQRSWHENAYAEMIERASGEPYGGTILNIVKKLSLKTVTEDPHTAFHLEYIPISSYSRKTALEDLWRLAVKIRTEDSLVHLPEHRPLENRDSCQGKYGSALCTYIDVCDQVMSINDDDRFADTNPLASYGPVEAT